MAGSQEVGSAHITIGAKTDKLKAGLQETKTGLLKLKDVAKEMGLGTMTAAALAAGAIYKIGAAVNDSIKETVAYNKTVRELTQTIGLGAEETSRIIQVSDDWGISIDEVRSSLEFANKNGFIPSIDNLAKLADEYVATEDKTQFAKKAVDIFGKSWTTLVPILAKGGKALREQTDAVDDSLIATDKSIAASRKYEVALDDLTDTIQGLEYSLGEGLLPELVKFFIAINEGIKTENKWAKLRTNMNALVKAGIITQKEFEAINLKVFIGTMQYNDVVVELADELDKLTHIEEYNTQIEREEAIRRGKTADATESLTKVTIDYQNVIGGNYRKALEGARDRLTAVKNALDDQREAAEKAQGAFNYLSDIVGGRLGPETKDFIKSQAELKEEMAGIQAEIATAISQGYSPLGEKVLGLQGQYDELNTQYGENATAHAEATRRMLFDIITQQAAIDGLTSTEVEMLTKIATGWGLVDEDTAEATKRAMEAFQYLATTGDAAGALEMLDNMDEAWLDQIGSIQQTKAEAQAYLNYLVSMNGITVTTHVKTIYDDIHTYPLPGGAQHGADFIVPAGYPNDSYPLRVESGEHVIVEPAGATNNTTNNFSWNVHTNAQSPNPMREYLMAKELAG